MQDKIVEIIVYIIREIQDNKQLGEIDLTELSESGYTESEISTALSWVMTRMSVEEGIFESKWRIRKQSRRMFHEVEKVILESEAQGYMLLLMEMGIIDAYDFEYIIDRILLSGYQNASVEQIKQIIASVVLEKGESDGVTGGTGRMIIYPRDTIH